MANPLSFLSGFFQKDGESVLGVDLGASSIKVVQLKKKKGKAVLETYGEVALGPYAQLSIGQATNLPPDVVATALKDVCKEANVTARKAALSVPLQASLVSLVDIPLPPDANLAQMIPLEARKYIPVPVSEVTLDWWVIPKRQNGFDDSLSAEKTPEEDKKAKTSEVLLVAIHNAMLDRVKSIVADAAFESGLFEIESFSAVRSVMGDELTPTLLLDIGAASTKIIIVDYGIVRISHVVSKGGQDITLALSKSLGITFDEAEEKKRTPGVIGSSDVIGSILEFLFYEASQVISSYQKKYQRSIGKVYLVGGGALLPGLAEEAKKRFGVDAHLGTPFTKTETPAFLEQVLSRAGPEFAVAVGLALRRLQDSK
ncbi:MAG: type IV pilus assembly protein PilM [Patescibacteria group bacterium]